MTRNQKKAALLCILFFVLIITTFGYMAISADHVCNGSSCAICAELEKNINAWQSWRISFQFYIWFSSIMFLVWVTVPIIHCSHYPVSLVQLKVKLTD